MSESVNPITAHHLDRLAEHHGLRITSIISQVWVQARIQAGTLDFLVDLAMLLDQSGYHITDLRHDEDDHTTVIATRKA